VAPAELHETHILAAARLTLSMVLEVRGCYGRVDQKVSGKVGHRSIARS
jgi:hypothetical protein